MKQYELLKKLRLVCPNGSIGEDNDGQIVFYTNCISQHIVMQEGEKTVFNHKFVMDMDSGEEVT